MFKRHSDSIDIKKLERETLRFLFLGFLFSIVFHAVLFSFVTYKKTEVKVIKPIQLRLVIRPPRMRTPFIIDRREFLRREIRKRFMMRMPSGKFSFKSTPSPEELMKAVNNLGNYLLSHKVA